MESLQAEGEKMFNYNKLWETMKKKGVTKYRLNVEHNISKSLLHRMRKNESVSMNTLDNLCNILNCDIEDVVTHYTDEEK